MMGYISFWSLLKMYPRKSVRTGDDGIHQLLVSAHDVNLLAEKLP
jgi:hypothetical protein